MNNISWLSHNKTYIKDLCRTKQNFKKASKLELTMNLLWMSSTTCFFLMTKVNILIIMILFSLYQDSNLRFDFIVMLIFSLISNLWIWPNIFLIFIQEFLVKKAIFFLVLISFYWKQCYILIISDNIKILTKKVIISKHNNKWVFFT